MSDPNESPPSSRRIATAKRKPRRASKRGFLTNVMLAAPLVAVPSVAGGSLLASGRSKSSGANGRSTSLTGQEVAAEKDRFFRQAWSRREAGQQELQAPAGSLVSTRDLPAPGQRAHPSAAAGPELAHFPIREAGVVRMQRELRQAMAKPIDQRKWIMVIDQQKCVGCSACTIACKAENQLPPGVVYRPVIEEEIGQYPNVTRRFLPRPCMQCDDPPCTQVCPVGATWKREDGIVVIDYEQCIGCRYCIAACPYGARYFDWGEFYSDGTPQRQPYEESSSPEYGKRWWRNGTSSPVGNVRKCQFCIHRLEAGMLPACVTTCIGGATYFGDKNDSENLVNELLATGRGVRLKEDKGTEPKVYYLV